MCVCMCMCVWCTCVCMYVYMWRVYECVCARLWCVCVCMHMCVYECVCECMLTVPLSSLPKQGQYAHQRKKAIVLQQLLPQTWQSWCRSQLIHCDTKVSWCFKPSEQNQFLLFYLLVCTVNVLVCTEMKICDTQVPRSTLVANKLT